MVGEILSVLKRLTKVSKGSYSFFTNSPLPPKLPHQEYFSQKTNSASQDETDSETKISPNKKFDPEAAQDELEKDIFVLSELIFEFNRYTLSWQSVAEAIARVDVLLAFSHSAMSAVGTTCWPQFVQGDKGRVERDFGVLWGIGIFKA